MEYWNGTTWADEPARATSGKRGPSFSSRFKPAVVIAVMALTVAAGSVFAKGGSGPTLSASFGAGTGFAPTSALTVSGTNYTPSAGGQQVIMWVGYPNDYCSPDKTVCHGFYTYPNVASDGTFTSTFTNVAMQSGTGTVSAQQWNPKNSKWVTVATTTYTVP